MSKIVPVAIFGAAGRMGHALIKTLAGTEGMQLAASVDREGCPVIGQDAGVAAGLPPAGVAISGDATAALAKSRVAIEFSTPSATVRHAPLAAEQGVAYVVGTTGLAEADEDILREAAERIPVVYAANYSVGMTLLAD